MNNPKNIKVIINLYGPFRRYSSDKSIVLNLHSGASLTDVKAAIVAEISKQQGEFLEHELLAQSAFADESNILLNDYILLQDTELTILPPVCGG